MKGSLCDWTKRVKSRRRANGFSLVELLVVVALIGLMAGAVVLVGLPGRVALRDEVSGMSRALRVAQDEAILTNRDIALRVTPQGYHYLSRGPEGWQEKKDRTLVSTLWKEGTSADFGDAPGLTIVFDSTGQSSGGDFILSRAGETRVLRIRENGELETKGQKEGVARAEGS